MPNFGTDLIFEFFRKLLAWCEFTLLTAGLKEQQQFDAEDPEDALGDVDLIIRVAFAILEKEHRG